MLDIERQHAILRQDVHSRFIERGALVVHERRSRYLGNTRRSDAVEPGALVDFEVVQRAVHFDCVGPELVRER